MPNDPGPLRDLYAMPGHLIRRAQQISAAIFAEECGGLDLTSVQFAALMAISANPGVDATRLSALIAFDRSTLGDVLERLEAKGWVQRSAAPQDRRIKLLALTPAGAALLRQVRPAVHRVQRRLLAPLAPEDRDTMLRLLAQLVHLHAASPNTEEEKHGTEPDHSDRRRRHRRPGGGARSGQSGPEGARAGKGAAAR